MRLQHRKDQMHDTYVQWLEDHGWLVVDVHNISGFVDALGVQIGSSKRGKCHARWVLFEFKSTAKDYGKDKARAAKQADLHQRLRNAGAEVMVIRSVADLAALVEAA